MHHGIGVKAADVCAPGARTGRRRYRVALQGLMVATAMAPKSRMFRVTTVMQWTRRAAYAARSRMLTHSPGLVRNATQVSTFGALKESRRAAYAARSRMLTHSPGLVRNATQVSTFGALKESRRAAYAARSRMLTHSPGLVRNATQVSTFGALKESRAVAAINASRSGRRSGTWSLAQRSAVASSTGRTRSENDGSTCLSSQDRRTSPCRGSRRSTHSTPISNSSTVIAARVERLRGHACSPREDVAVCASFGLPQLRYDVGVEQVHQVRSGQGS